MNLELKIVVQKLKNLYHLFVAFIANIWFGFPSHKLKVIGVTGTDGKTTTTHLIAHILKSAGKKVSFISSIYAEIADQEYDTGFHVTTPSSFTIQKFLNLALANNNEYFVLETTSHALDQNRVWGIKYAVSVITNISLEHTDYHGNLQNYLKVKMKIFKSSGSAVINRDDQSYKLIKKNFNLKIRTYGLRNKVDFIWNDKIELSFPGEFNKYNVLAAYSVCKILGIDEKIILKAIYNFRLPKGRMETVYDKDFKIIIDFAHTPNALENVLKTVKEKYLSKKGKLIHVFGSAGLRDFAKRPLMGKVSNKYANLIILTEEDYRTEDPLAICQQIAQGIEKKRFDVIINRQKAINEAIRLAQPNDVVIVTGKAHEKSLCRGKKEYVWDDYKAVQTALLVRNN